MRKVLLLFLIMMLSLVSCSEEELILEANPDNNSVEVENDNSPDTSGDSNNDCNDSGSNETEIINEILDLVNNHRQSVGKSTLELDCVANELAINHTKYMISQDLISHNGFQERFQELQQRVNAKSVGENVASGYSSAENVMHAWLNSEGHKTNIEGNFTHIGIAAIKNSKGTLFYTQLFYR